MADGLIVDARSSGVSGPQIDAAVPSPAPRLRSPVTAAPETYVVKAGDSLYAIAERFGLDPQAIARANNLSDPDKVFAGQQLVVGAQPVQRSLLPVLSPIERIQFWPWPPMQGQTLAVWLQARDAVTLTLGLAGRTYEAELLDGRGWALLPIGVMAEPGTAPLEIRTDSGLLRVQLPVQAGTFPTIQLPQSTGGGILDDAEKVRSETLRMSELFALPGTDRWLARARFAFPLVGDFPKSAPFGQRRTYGDAPAVSAHAGQDFSAPPGTPVYAPASGRVVLAEQLFVRGNAVVLEHGAGVFSGYWHLSELSVKPGDTIATGQLLGKVGSTGLSTGAHLHWEMRIAGAAVDPLQWVVR